MSGADVATFEVLNADPTGYMTRYARDKNSVYSEDERLVKVDPNSVELIGFGDSYLVTNIGLFSGEKLIFETSKEYLNVYLVEQLEGENPYYIFVHDTKVDKWFSYIENELQPIDKPHSSELGMLIYPSPAQ